MNEDNAQSQITEPPLASQQEQVPQTKPKKSSKSLLLIPISLILSVIITLALSSLTSSSLGASIGFGYVVLPILFLVILVIMFYINSRRSAHDQLRKKSPIVIDVLGLSCGFLVALFSVSFLLKIIYPTGTNFQDGFSLVIIIYFISWIYGGFRILQYIYTTLQKT